MNPRALRALGPAILVVAAVAALVTGLGFGGGAAPLVLGDPGPFVRWGLPVAQLLVNLAAAGMVGTLVMALFGLKAGARPWEVALDVASISAALFTVGAAATGFLTFLNAFNPVVDLSPTFGDQLGRFLTERELGVAWLITTVWGALLTVMIFALRGWTATLIAAVLAAASLIPIATQGHSGDLSSHNIAVTSLALHMAAAAVWLGGLVAVVVVRPLLGAKATATLVARYSSLALAAFCVLAVSGTARAMVGLGGWAGWLTGYGGILAVKVAALAALGVLGALYRTRLIARLGEDAPARRFWTLVGVELALMGLASGAAVALSRTPPPNAEQPPSIRTPAEILTGSPLPPELTIARWFTATNIDLLWVVVVAFGIAFYLAGVWRLRRRGDEWPLYRTVLWVLGMLLLLWVTSGPINAYQEYLFSVHMVGHMLLTMAVPVLLVPGAPVTLAARAIAKRRDGTRGGREWILWAVHTPYARVLTNPWVTAVLFVASLWIFYYTDLFRWSMYDHLGHEWMVVHFLIVGYLFVQSLIGIDPVPYRLPYALRLLMLIGVIAVHSFFGVAVMMQTGLFVAEWFGSMARTWGATPLQDQYVGGGAAWSIGEIPTIVLATVVGIQWSRADERMQRRRDRDADRTGDAELVDYNARLAALAARDAHRAE